MKKTILLILAGIITSGCATGYPKVEGELMRVYLADRHVKSQSLDPCFFQMVPTGYAATVIITKDKILEIPMTKGYLEYCERNKDSCAEPEIWDIYQEEYQEALEEGIEEYTCTDKKRTDKDILHESDYPKVCPIIRQSHYTKDDKEFIEVFKNEFLLRDYLEIPKSLGIKIYNKGLPLIQYEKEVLETAIPAPNRKLCIAMPLKEPPLLPIVKVIAGREKDGKPILKAVDLNYDEDGKKIDRGSRPGDFFKSYPTPKERKNMLKDKDPNIYWEYPSWGGFFTPDGKVNKDKLKSKSK